MNFEAIVYTVLKSPWEKQLVVCPTKRHIEIAKKKFIKVCEFLDVAYAEYVDKIVVSDPSNLSAPAGTIVFSTREREGLDNTQIHLYIDELEPRGK